jgi:hypothetical protein
VASDFDTIGSKESYFYAEYWHKEEFLVVLIRDASGAMRDERRGLKFDGWLELKSSDNPEQTYLNHYRPKPVDHSWALKAGIFISPAAKRRTPAEIAENRRCEEANRPMGCGMKLFLFWIGACGLVLLASLVGNLLKR